HFLWSPLFRHPPSPGATFPVLRRNYTVSPLCPFDCPPGNALSLGVCFQLDYCDWPAGEGITQPVAGLLHLVGHSGLVAILDLRQQCPSVAVQLSAPQDALRLEIEIRQQLLSQDVLKPATIR